MQTIENKLNEWNELISALRKSIPANSQSVIIEDLLRMGVLKQNDAISSLHHDRAFYKNEIIYAGTNRNQRESIKAVGKNDEFTFRRQSLDRKGGRDSHSFDSTPIRELRYIGSDFGSIDKDSNLYSHRKPTIILPVLNKEINADETNSSTNIKENRSLNSTFDKDDKSLLRKRKSAKKSADIIRRLSLIGKRNKPARMTSKGIILITNDKTHMKKNTVPASKRNTLAKATRGRKSAAGRRKAIFMPSKHNTKLKKPNKRGRPAKVSKTSVRDKVIEKSPDNQYVSDEFQPEIIEQRGIKDKAKRISQNENANNNIKHSLNLEGPKISSLEIDKEPDNSSKTMSGEGENSEGEGVNLKNQTEGAQINKENQTFCSYKNRSRIGELLKKFKLGVVKPPKTDIQVNQKPTDQEDTSVIKKGVCDILNIFGSPVINTKVPEVLNTPIPVPTEQAYDKNRLRRITRPLRPNKSKLLYNRAIRLSIPNIPMAPKLEDVQSPKNPSPQKPCITGLKHTIVALPRPMPVKVEHQTTLVNDPNSYLSNMQIPEIDNSNNQLMDSDFTIPTWAASYETKCKWRKQVHDQLERRYRNTTGIDMEAIFPDEEGVCNDSPNKWNLRKYNK